jgi:hypothetical protein
MRAKSSALLCPVAEKIGSVSAEALRLAISSQPILINEISIPINISIGGIVPRSDFLPPSELISAGTEFAGHSREKCRYRLIQQRKGGKSYPVNLAPLRVNKRAQPLLLNREEHEV